MQISQLILKQKEIRHVECTTNLGGVMLPLLGQFFFHPGLPFIFVHNYASVRMRKRGIR